MGLSLRGATSGAIDINAPAVAGDNTITLPSNNGSANQFFRNSGTAGIVTYSSLTENSSGDVSIAGVTTISGYVDATSYINTTGGLFSTGLIQGRRTDSTNEVFRGQDSSSTRTSFILGNGSASFGSGTFTIASGGQVINSQGFQAGGDPAGGNAGSSLGETGQIQATSASNGTVFAARTSGSTTKTFEVLGNGTITATGNFTTGGSIISEANPEASDTTNGAMLDKVKVIVRNSAGQSVWLGYKNGTSGATSSINVDGDTTIRDLTARTVTSSDQVISNRSGTSVCFRAQDGGTDNFTVKASGALDANGRADIGTNSLDDYAVAGFSSSATYGGIYAQNNNANGYLFTGQENSTEVFKVYANGRINSGNPYASGNGVNIFGGGSIYIRQDGSTGGVLRIRNGSDYKIELKGNGDADFAGAVKIGGTAAANQMDEYEEGTWTPVFYFGGAASGAVFAMQEGHYVKIGRQVIAQFRIELTNKGSSTGSMTISTPFAVLNTFTSTGIDGNALVGYTGGMSSTQVGSAPVSGYCEGGTSLAYFTARLSSGNAATLNQTDVENNFSIAGTMFFYAA